MVGAARPSISRALDDPSRRSSGSPCRRARLGGSRPRPRQDPGRPRRSEPDVARPVPAGSSPARRWIRDRRPRTHRSRDDGATHALPPPPPRRRPRRSRPRWPHRLRQSTPRLRQPAADLVEAAEPPSAERRPSGDLEELDRAWPDIVADLSKSPPTQAAHRGLPADRGRRQRRHPRLPRGPVVPQGRRRAAAARRSRTGIGRAPRADVAVRLVATNLDLRPPAGSTTTPTRVLDAARRIFADDLVDAGEVG